MAKFLIEVPHEAETIACARAAKVLLETGSHFLTHADFGCCDGVHKAWIIVDVDSKEEARSLLRRRTAARPRSCSCASSDSMNWTTLSSVIQPDRPNLLRITHCRWST